MIIKREDYLKRLIRYKDNEDIKVISGIHRCGKTYLLKQLIDELKNNGVDDENIIYLPLESSYYDNLTDNAKLNEYIFNKTENTKGKVYLLFDEIQTVKNWEKSINAYRIDLDADIYITGSNSTLLQGKLATLLTGRYITINIYPLSYKELLTYYQNKEGRITGEDEIEIFNRYMEYGGFPRLIDYKYDEDKEYYLKDLLDSIILKDVIKNNKINDIDLLYRLIDYIIENMGCTFSANSIAKFLKHENRTTSTGTIINYLTYLTNAFILYKCNREDIVGKKRLAIMEKYYLTDTGFYPISSYNKNIGQKLENIVYLELKRRNYEITIGKLKDLEIDFICRKGKKIIYIQVSQSIIDPSTQEREFKPLEKIRDNYPKYVLTR